MITVIITVDTTGRIAIETQGPIRKDGLPVLLEEAVKLARQMT